MKTCFSYMTKRNSAVPYNAPWRTPLPTLNDWPSYMTHKQKQSNKLTIRNLKHPPFEKERKLVETNVCFKLRHL